MGDFAQYIIEDCLKNLHGLRSRKMFGGHGLYYNNKFCGIISGDKLYFKTDEKSAKKYIGSGTKPFTYAPGKTLKTYYEVPHHVIEDSDELVEWIKVAAKSSQSFTDNKKVKQKN